MVDVTWDAEENGSPIFGYIITFLQSDGATYETELTSCDGSNPSIVTDKSCSVPIASLRASSFQLLWGSSIYAKVVAINLYGESVASEPGNGAIILTFPDVPLNTAENYSLREAYQLAITWEEGAANGGTPVIDYRVKYQTGDTLIVVENIEALTLIASSLTNAVNYVFTVEARNSFGYSDPSD
jgi:hypothetical protein